MMNYNYLQFIFRLLYLFLLLLCLPMVYIDLVNLQRILNNTLFNLWGLTVHIPLVLIFIKYCSVITHLFQISASTHCPTQRLNSQPLCYHIHKQTLIHQPFVLQDSLKFSVCHPDPCTPEDCWRAQWPKCDNSKDEDNSLTINSISKFNLRKERKLSKTYTLTPYTLNFFFLKSMARNVKDTIFLLS